MKSKKAKVDHDDPSKLPHDIMQAFFCLFWPPNSLLKKFIIVIVFILLGSFAIWSTLPEKTKMEVVDYLKGVKKVQSPLIVSSSKEPSANIQKDIRQHTEGNRVKKVQSPIIVPSGKVPSVTIQKDIRQHTEGDQSPAVVSKGDVNIIIESKESKNMKE